MSIIRLCLVHQKSERMDGSDWRKTTLSGQDWEIRIWLLGVSLRKVGTVVKLFHPGSKIHS